MPAYIELPKEALVRAYNETGSCVKVAKLFGVSKKTILNRFKSYGIDMTGKRQLESYREKVIELVAKKVTAKEAGKILCVSSTHASQLARSFGLSFYDPFHKGYILTHNGYRLIRKPEHHGADHKGYIREHRYIAEQAIGRHLHDNEVVHHINGNKSDNRAENLQVMDSKEHVKLHHTGKKGRGSDLKPRKNSRQHKDMI